jgi:carbamoyl-phosphate synthase large subunit
MSISLLVTGAGAPGIAGTIFALRNNPDKRIFNIVTTDIKDDCVGKYMADSFYILPAPESLNYFNVLKRIIEKEQISVILPQTTREIEFYSKNKNLLTELNVSVIVSDYSGIQRANDKYLIIKACESVGIPYPDYFLIKSIDELKNAVKKLDYPKKKVVVKPRFSNGLRGVRVLTEEGLSFYSYIHEKPGGLDIDLDNFLKIFSNVLPTEFPELLVTEYMPGEEYSVDMFRNKNGTVVVPRLRRSIRSGISFETEVDLSKSEIISYSNLLADYLDLKFCFGFQFKLDENGIPKILESNPRVQGTMVASLFAGFNMIYYSVKEVLGEEVTLENVTLTNNSEFKRYWGGVGMLEGKPFLI